MAENNNDKNLKNLYLRHVSDTAPDMDKLWNKIEKRIDNEEKTSDTPLPQIKHTHTGRLIACAAAFAVICAAGGIYAANSGKINATTTSEKSYEKQTVQKENTAQNTTVEKPEYTDEYLQTNTDYADMQAEKSENNLIASDNAAEGDTNGLSESEDKSADYNTPVYIDSFVAPELSFANEQDIIAQTEYFAHCTITDVNITDSHAVYTISTPDLTSKDKTSVSTDFTITSTSPYIMQKGMEYYLPLRTEDNSYAIVTDGIPQIELTPDGSLYFPDIWESISEKSDKASREKLGDKDSYSESMRLGDKELINEIINEWEKS